MSKITIINGDALAVLRTLPGESVHCVVTSPPYWRQRDYGVPGQLGLERTPEEYMDRLVEIFHEVRRVLRPDGTVWLNLGDCYAASKGVSAPNKDGKDASWKGVHGENMPDRSDIFSSRYHLKPKDLIGIPWLVSLALREDGWYLRAPIIWHKTNPMPSSATDRPTLAHEYIFLLAKQDRYFYDAAAIAEPAVCAGRKMTITPKRLSARAVAGGGGDRRTGNAVSGSVVEIGATRNKRSVWAIPTRPFAEAHFATFPPDLPELCIKAGTGEKGVCPTCGTPWERVTRRGDLVPTGRGGSRKMLKLIAERKGQKSTETSAFATGAIYEQITIGWRPTCRCYPRVSEWPSIPVRDAEESEKDYMRRIEPLHKFQEDLLEFWAPMAKQNKPAVVLDPFGGAGTTGMVAARLLRDAILIELNPRYCEMAARRIRRDGGMFVTIERRFCDALPEHGASSAPVDGSREMHQNDDGSLSMGRGDGRGGLRGRDESYEE